MNNVRMGRKCRQAGQAMVEFLVAAVFFLVPLFLAIAALGKFIDVQHTTEMAARYSAWERTVWYPPNSGFDGHNGPNEKSAAHIHNEMAVRTLSKRSGATLIKNTDKDATTLVNGIDPMWHDTAGKAYLSAYADVASTQTLATPDTDVAAAALDKMSKVNVRGFVNFVPPVPNTDTMAVAEVSLNGISSGSAVYKRLWSPTAAWLGLDFKATGAIMSNTWAANGNAATKSMVETMVPTAQGLGAVVDAAKTVIPLWEPGLGGSIEVGKVAVDVVPADRLK